MMTENLLDISIPYGKLVEARKKSEELQHLLYKDKKYLDDLIQKSKQPCELDEIFGDFSDESIERGINNLVHQESLSYKKLLCKKTRLRSVRCKGFVEFMM